MRYLGYRTGIKVNAVVEEVNGGYIAYIPYLPGCFSIGNTIEEAVEDLRELVEDQLGLDLEVNSSISSLSDFTLEMAG